MTSMFVRLLVVALNGTGGAIGQHCFFIDMKLEHQYPGDYTSKLASNQAGIEKDQIPKCLSYLMLFMIIN